MRRTRGYATVLAPRLLRFPFFAACAYRSDRVTSSFRLCSFTDRTQGVSLWVPFQTAAGTVTSLYKGACTSLVSLVNNVSKINLHSNFLMLPFSFFITLSFFCRFSSLFYPHIYSVILLYNRHLHTTHTHSGNVFACICASDRFAQLTNAEGQLLIDANFQDYYEYL